MGSSVLSYVLKENGVNIATRQAVEVADLPAWVSADTQHRGSRLRFSTY